MKQYLYVGVSWSHASILFNYSIFILLLPLPPPQRHWLWDPLNTHLSTARHSSVSSRIPAASDSPCLSEPPRPTVPRAQDPGVEGSCYHTVFNGTLVLFSDANVPRPNVFGKVLGYAKLKNASPVALVRASSVVVDLHSSQRRQVGPGLITHPCFHTQGTMQHPLRNNGF